jgi:metal-responsive CopG/Arc/MetJ family transcriptional regulator
MPDITKDELVRAQLLLDKKLFEQLRRYAFKVKTSKSEIARRAIRLFLEEVKNNK